MVIVAPILSATVGLQSVALLGHAYGTQKKIWGLTNKKKFNSRKATKTLVGGGVGLLVGTALLKPTAKIINTI